MVRWSQKIANNESFQTIILLLILINGAIMGMETVPQWQDQYGDWFWITAIVSQAVFVFEIAVRIVAYWPNARRFFTDFWNCFDFVIVLASILPFIGSVAFVGRLLRILRMLRVVSVSDEMREFVVSCRASAHVGMRIAVLVLVLSYIFSVSGFYLLGEIDPAHWGSLGRCFVSVFYLALLQDIPGFVEPAIVSEPGTFLFFFFFYGAYAVLLLSAIGATVVLTQHAPRTEEKA